MLHETFAYPKKLSRLEWKYPNGMWSTELNSKDNILIIVCNCQESDIEVINNGIKIQRHRIDVISSAENIYAYIYKATGNIKINVKNVSDVNGSIFISTEEIDTEIEPTPIGPTYGSVDIDGTTYKTVTIGNLEWLVDNLDYKFNGLTVGPSDVPYNEPKAWYYNNDESTYGKSGIMKCGLLYNYYAVEYLENNRLELLPRGWRVSNENDWENLVRNLNNGSPSVSGIANKMKAEDGYVLSNFPINWNGNNESGLSVIPTGKGLNSEVTPSYVDFSGIGESCTFWIISKNNVHYNDSKIMGFNSSNSITLGSVSLNTGNPVRLVRDVLV